MKNVPLSLPCLSTPAAGPIEPQGSWGWAGLQDRSDVAQLQEPIPAEFSVMTPQARPMTLRHVTCIQWAGGS